MSRIARMLECALVCAACAPAVSGAVVVGIADGNTGTFADPRFLALPITIARNVVPWGIVTRRADRGDLRRFGVWLRAARAGGGRVSADDRPRLHPRRDRTP